MRKSRKRALAKKRESIGVDLAPTPKRQPDGRIRPVSDDPQRTARNARQRHCAVTADDALDPALGTDMGRCIRALHDGEERAQLLDAWGALCAARRNFLMRQIGVTGDPQCAASPMIHETVETDPSLRVDLRTAAERDEAARRAWEAWEVRVKALPYPQMRWAIRGALNGFLGDGRLWKDGAPTATGRAAVMALRWCV